MAGANNTQATSSLVPKPWGCEYLAFGDANVAVWYLHIRRGEATSQHYHDTKDTLLIVLSGEVRVNNTVLMKGESRFLPAGTVHRTEAIADSWLVEIETPNDKGDLVRVSDEYGREGKPYEAKRLPLNGYEFPSKEFP